MTRQVRVALGVLRLLGVFLAVLAALVARDEIQAWKARDYDQWLSTHGLWRRWSVPRWTTVDKSGLGNWWRS